MFVLLLVFFVNFLFHFLKEEKGKGASLLSLSLKKRRTKIEIQKDKEMLEEEKNIVKDARQLMIENINLQQQKQNDDLMIAGLQAEIQKLRENPENQLFGESHIPVYQPPH